MKISPSGLCATLLLHGGVFFLLNTTTQHNTRYITQDQLISVALPVSPSKPDTTPTDIPLPDNFLVHNKKQPDIPIPASKNDDANHYYLPAELSVPVTVLFDSTQQLDLIFNQEVIVQIYINQLGNVDDIIIERDGDLSEEQKQDLRNTLRKMVFTPGLRGEKVVKALFRIQLVPPPIKIILPY